MPTIPSCSPRRRTRRFPERVGRDDESGGGSKEYPTGQQETHICLPSPTPSYTEKEDTRPPPRIPVFHRTFTYRFSLPDISSSHSSIRGDPVLFVWCVTWTFISVVVRPHVQIPPSSLDPPWTRNLSKVATPVYSVVNSQITVFSCTPGEILFGTTRVRSLNWRNLNKGVVFLPLFFIWSKSLNKTPSFLRSLHLHETFDILLVSKLVNKLSINSSRMIYGPYQDL